MEKEKKSVVTQQEADKTIIPTETLPATLQAVGSLSTEFINNLTNQISFSTPGLRLDNGLKEFITKEKSFALSVLNKMNPQDEMEGMIVAQMISIHNATMNCLLIAGTVQEDISLQDKWDALSQTNKLSRTYAVLMDTLNRHRSKDTQNLIVGRVDVHSGGQAIVGNLKSGNS